MSNPSDKIKELKLKLNSAQKIKLQNERKLFSLRAAEQALSEEIALLSVESEFTSQQIETIKQEIFQMKYQTTMIEICSASEKAKIENYKANINNHKNNFEILFAKECEFLELHNKQLREKEAEKEELERQKHMKVLELNEQMAKEATAIEEECENIERECIVLRKRNKAIMLTLRRKVIEDEKTRRTLMSKK